MSVMVTYLDHSGFAVAAGRHLMIFDYSNDDGQPRDLSGGVITPVGLSGYSPVSVFVSHAHSDHFNPAIYRWADASPRYILSYDIQGNYAGERMRPGDTLVAGEMTVFSFGSTDLGVSYLAETCGVRVFHAGDLNWWHWREESTPREIEQAERDFKREMEPIIAEAKRAPFDIAFFPLDPRQKTFYEAGANYFIMSVKPKIFIPMHTMGQTDLIADYARHSQMRGTKIIHLPRRGQQFLYEKEETP